MSRVEELNKAIRMSRYASIESKEVTNVMLVEIAKSLAVIADNMTAGKNKMTEEPEINIREICGRK